MVGWVLLDFVLPLKFCRTALLADDGFLLGIHDQDWTLWNFGQSTKAERSMAHFF